MENIRQRIPTPYADLNAVLQDLVDSTQTIDGSKFIGAFLQGPFAVGDFDRHSDVDFIIVIQEELSDYEVESLRVMHERIFHHDTRWAQHLEGLVFRKPSYEIIRGWVDRSGILITVRAHWNDLTTATRFSFAGLSGSLASPWLGRRRKQLLIQYQPPH